MGLPVKKKLSNQEVLDRLIARRKLQRKLEDIADELDIPIILDIDKNPMVYFEELWEIFSDEKKLKDLVSRIKLKTFW